MEDREILKLFDEGYSINYIARKLYKMKNKDNKAKVVNGCLFFENKPYTMAQCRVFVSRILYKNYMSSRSVSFKDHDEVI